MDFNSLDDKFKSVMEDNEDKNHGHIDVKTNTDIVAAKNNIIGIKKDDVIFYPIVDIAKLFDTPAISGNFLVYVFLKQLFPIIFKRRCELKKSYFFAASFHRPYKEKEN